MIGGSDERTLPEVKSLRSIGTQTFQKDVKDGYSALRPERLAAAQRARMRAAIAARAAGGMVRRFRPAGALVPFCARAFAQRLRAPARIFARPSGLSRRLPPACRGAYELLFSNS